MLLFWGFYNKKKIAASSADAGVKLEEDDDGDTLETIILDVTSVVVGFIVVSGVSIGVVIVNQGLRISLFQQNDNIYGCMQICAAESFSPNDEESIELWRSAMIVYVDFMYLCVLVFYFMNDHLVLSRNKVIV